MRGVFRRRECFAGKRRSDRTLASWRSSYANRRCAAREVRDDDQCGNPFSRPRKMARESGRELRVAKTSDNGHWFCNDRNLNADLLPSGWICPSPGRMRRKYRRIISRILPDGVVKFYVPENGQGAENHSLQCRPGHPAANGSNDWPRILPGSSSEPLRALKREKKTR